MSIAAIADHLWQSTVFAAIAAGAALACRHDRAAARHALWLAASIKFLVPVAAVIVFAQQIAPHPIAPAVPRNVGVMFDTVGQPFTGIESSREPGTTAPTPGSTAFRTIAVTIWAGGFITLAATWCRRWQRARAIARHAAPITTGQALQCLRRLEHAHGITRPIALAEADGSIEPGVFGIVSPVVLWPAAIAARLDEPEVAAILAHEVAHVRRRDNLAAAVHMLVEALFWFHPLVWWIGARLLDERERACDEDVLWSGSDPVVYATSLVKASRACLESSLPCVAGVTGSTLASRVERIMRDGAARPLSATKRLAVAAVVVVPFAAPILVGAATARPPIVASHEEHAYAIQAGAQAPVRFEVASVKPNTSPAGKVTIQTLPGGRFTAANATLKQLIRSAYQLQDFQISGGPAWIASDRFDIVAKADTDGSGAIEDRLDGPAASQLMLRLLLADEFKLQVHNDTRELPIYRLRRVRPNGTFGPQLAPSSRDCAAIEREMRGPAGGNAATEPPPCGLRILPGTIAAGGVTLAQLANALSGLVGRIVRDQTDVADAFEFTLRWTPDQIPAGFDRKAAAMGLAPIEPQGASLFTALKEQLGLQLEPGRGPVETLIVDRAEKPHAN